MHIVYTASVLADYAVIIQAVIPAFGSSLPACPNCSRSSRRLPLLSC
ncbi:hypothetical protein CHCC20375_0273 [Bacillus licheniformis]|nr:hypothetical protein CHCC20375_0273 [Bacillus licheniformis]